MFGPDDKCLHSSDDIQVGLRGIVPRACKEIFETLSYRKTNLDLKIESSLAVSYIEVYGSQICDLLQRGSPCCPNKAASQRFVLSGAAEVPVNDVTDVVKSLLLGEKQKRRAATAMNDRSSRAHSIFIITLNQKCDSTGVSRTSKLFLVDLGGCEQTKKSGVVSGSSKHFDKLKRETMQPASESESGLLPEPNDANGDNAEHSTGFVQSDRMREAVYINLGLLALKVSATRTIIKIHDCIPTFQDTIDQTDY